MARRGHVFKRRKGSRSKMGAKRRQGELEEIVDRSRAGSKRRSVILEKMADRGEASQLVGDNTIGLSLQAQALTKDTKRGRYGGRSGSGKGRHSMRI